MQNKYQQQRSRRGFERGLRKKFKTESNEKKPESNGETTGGSGEGGILPELKKEA